MAPLKKMDNTILQHTLSLSLSLPPSLPPSITMRKVQRQVEGEQVAQSNEAKKSATCKSTHKKLYIQDLRN